MRAAILAAVLAVVLVPVLALAPAAAAQPKLTLVSEATYQVLPDEGRIAVNVRLIATNHLKDTVARHFFFRTAVLTVLPGVSNLEITGGGGEPTVSVTAATDTYTNLKLDFGGMLAAGKSTRLNLTFDLRETGNAPDRAVRISPSLVTFTAWAYATPETPGSSVAVRFPRGYAVTVGGGQLTGPEPDAEGFERWSSGTLAAPLEFVADVAAARPAQFEETTRTVPLAEGSATILLRSWPDDPAWRDRVGSLVDQALPILEREIGLPWPVDGTLAIHEALVRGPGGYAGLFDPAAGEIEISYAAPNLVVLHELAHAWFNGRFVADRWVAEAFASYYADLAAAELGLAAAPPAPPDHESEPIPLNAWGPSGSETAAAETYAYAASLELAGAVASRAGPNGLREVWALARRGMGAYGADPAADDASPRPPDWRGLLDLLEETTGERFADLWRTYVARPQDEALLADRAVARDHYLRTATLAGAWELPPSIRDAMREWQFGVAEERLRVADDVLSQRAALEGVASAAGLALPDALREAFEGSQGPEAAVAEATAEQATVDAIVAARAARPAASGMEELIISIGLLTVQPEAELAAAETALAAGDLQAAYVAAQSAHSTWSSAGDAGRSRIVSAALLFLVLILFAYLVRRERRKRSAVPG